MIFDFEFVLGYLLQLHLLRLFLQILTIILPLLLVLQSKLTLEPIRNRNHRALHQVPLLGLNPAHMRFHLILRPHSEGRFRVMGKRLPFGRMGLY